ncbi:MAG: Beta-lactamase class A [Candidatus Woesebacteria bacterium GW2011_GWB1_38_5]|uniref:Beta-lactamase class A n=4 Tax=Candidatus Woeseibacteriota TaxID=1752722 RepID=A0A0G0NBM2_9BACT|nr:MAG: Beta-lactamase class A [Candidatus Woesebacteria bacterium GW2011_GWD1_38_10]KKQ55719.1 MAG: Beta-lactamase class A [Candidatus Woesebacteria bacterium GW2011_GWC1_38_13]KKQ74506.1 MAG: Beta-lactamase class A [Candidatus Woesebacteria bacterium GW2011_GWB1_38_5]KKQ82740.1 MAG: Beta-lactamase class A [Candidatus Woesebacteria bacterium GW2011_GWA1_38_8]
MGIFNKKEKAEREENEENKEDVRTGGEERKVKIKKIKDLNSKERVRRKEPIRAWNKFDRVFLFLLMIITSGWSFYFAVSSRGWKMPTLPNINLSEINPFGSKTIVLGPGQGAADTKSENVLSKFEESTDRLTGVYGLYVTDLASGHSFGIYENNTFQAASLIKLPVMVGMYMSEEDGALSLNTRYILKTEDKVRGSGSLYNKPAGYQISYRDLLKLMGKESDNTAFNICRKHLGDEKIQDIINGIGMKGTSLEKNETTPADIGSFFYKLWNGQLLNMKNTDELLINLTDTSYEDWLTAGVPESIRVAHKYGRETGVVNDAGIVYSENPYIAVMLGKNVVLKEADSIFPELSKIIYDGMVEDNK